METAWIQVFVLSLTQCIAPAGKMVCQQETVEYQFANEQDCTRALHSMADLAERSDNVLVDRDRSACRAAVVQMSVFDNADSARATLDAGEDLVVIEGHTADADFTRVAHDERLAQTKSCEETGGVAPCKIGEIILEAAADSSPGQVWRRDH